MRKIILVLIIIIMFSTNVFAVTNTAQEKAVEYLNQYRTKLNLPTFTINSNLNRSAQSHSEYMNKNGLFTHEQNKDNPLFTGVYPWDRTSYFKYKNNNVAEFINNQSTDLENFMFKLMNNPYDRIQLLNPLYRDIGLGSKQDSHVIQVGGKNINNEYEVRYPLDNQKNVSYVCDLNDTINPYRNTVDNKKQRSSLPISYSFYTTKSVKGVYVKDSDVTLLDKNNNELIPIKINTVENDKYLTNSILILPLQQLKPETEYEVNIKAIKVKVINSSTLYRKPEKWSFTTSSIKDSLQKISSIELQTQITRQQFAEIMLFNNYKVNYYNTHSVEEFEDVDSSSAYAKYIYKLKEMKVINGCGNNQFKPHNYLTREEAIVSIMRLYDYMLGKDYQHEQVEMIHFFRDIEQCSSWARIAIAKAYDYGLIKGREYNILDPKAEITFAEAWLLVDRLYNYVETEAAVDERNSTKNR